MTLTISRSEMVDWMQTDGYSEIKERPRHNWQRINTLVVDQQSGEIEGVLSDFHLFELNLGGTRHLDARTDMEGGDSGSYVLAPGSQNYQQSRVPAEFIMDGPQTIQQIYIDDSVFQDVARGTGLPNPEQVNTSAFMGIFDPAMKNIASALLNEARRPSAGGDLYADLMAQQLALLILRRQHTRHSETAARGALGDTETARILEFLHADLSANYSIDVLADLLDMDAFTFTRAFKARIGQAPHQYLIALRLERIKELLTTSQDSLADIAYATGFSSQSHMTSMFSKSMGMPPGRYRAAARR